MASSHDYIYPMPLSSFHPVVARWFQQRFGEPTAPQRLGWDAIRSGRHTLIAAPTGSGKTLAAFLHSLDQLLREGLEGPLPDETRILYVSPLKALSADIHLNLAEPRREIRRLAEEMGLDAPRITAAIRSGDTPAADRAAMIKKPPHILVTTPESLYLLLTAQRSREMLRTVRTVIVDEIHAVLESRRGAHLALTLERLEHVAQRPVQRIGLSATVKPIEEVGEWLVGTGTAPAIVDQGHRRALDLALELPSSPLEAVMSGEVVGRGLRPPHRPDQGSQNYPRIRQHSAPRRAGGSPSGRAAGRGSGDRSPRQSVQGDPARRRGTAQGRQAPGAGGHSVTRARHRHRPRRPGVPAGDAAPDLHLPPAGGPLGAHGPRHSQGAAVPAHPGRAGRVHRHHPLGPPGAARPDHHPGEAARRAGPARRGRDGGRGLAGRGPLPAVSPGLPVPELWSEPSSTRWSRCWLRASPPGGAAARH